MIAIARLVIMWLYNTLSIGFQPAKNMYENMFQLLKKYVDNTLSFHSDKVELHRCLIKRYSCSTASPHGMCKVTYTPISVFQQSSAHDVS